MKNNILILRSPDSPISKAVAWEKIGRVVDEISELYQIVKESTIDLIIVDENRFDLKFPVAARIRRFHALTEIWKVRQSQYDLESEEDFIDGNFTVDLGQKGIKERVKHILKTKEMLRRFHIVGRSRQMKAVAENIDRIAPTDVPVLIVGPSGSGKELVSKALHENSSRSGSSFVAINCGALPEGLLESELFGHEKGAFTGAVGKREGLFDKAEQGTIFLDEIGETKPETQVKLLRVLEDGTYYPVGSSVPKQSNARIISATNRDLTEAIAEKNFREDLYFRIGVVKINLPPLFERKQDIQPLIQHFWSKNRDLKYTDSALELLMKYDWPGNVRQLRNFADRMAAIKPSGTVEFGDVESFIDEQHSTVRTLPVATGKTVEEAGQELIYHAILQLGSEIKLLRDLITAHLPAEQEFGGYSDEVDSSVTFKGMTVDEMEKIMIRQVLAETRGNRKEAAKRLGIGERTLYRKLKQYKIS